MKTLNSAEMLELVAMIERGERPPTRDLLLALEQSRRHTDTVEQIKRQVARMQELPLLRRQAN